MLAVKLYFIEVKSGVSLRWTNSNFTAEMSVSKSVKGYSILRLMTYVTGVYPCAVESTK